MWRLPLSYVAAVLLCVPLRMLASAASNPVTAEPMRAALASPAGQEIQLWDWGRWQPSMAGLYAKRNFAPLWFVDGRLTRTGVELLEQLRAVERRGLIASDYDGEHLTTLIKAATGSLTPSRLVRFDVAMSVTAARLASDLERGRVDPATVGYDLDIREPPFDAAAAVTQLAAAADIGKALDAFEPHLRHYWMLKSVLIEYRELARNPDLTRLPPLPRISVRPGESYAGAPSLRRLLLVLGDLTQTSSSPLATDTVLDPALVSALTRFQGRHGLAADGVLGRATFKALTMPLAARVQQILLSLERVRWLPQHMDAPPIIVNVPQFRLFAFRTTEDVAQDMLQMDVIVGAAFEGRQTPVFAADMSYVVLQPYWDVPRSILMKELMPEIRANPDWLTKNDYEIVRGAGDDAAPVAATPRNLQLLASGKLRLRQKPGPANALGRVKFIFPNRHNVYLHDTPMRGLFARTRRAFSHGCIRVADPMGLLAHVLRNEPDWNEARVSEALRKSTPTRVPLTHPIRVYILYGTALATEDGATRFFDDIYDQDAPLTRLLHSRRARALATPD